MKRTITIVVFGVVMLTALSVLAGPYKAGARVLAQYKGGDTWYVAKVVSHKGSRVEVTYLEGGSETLGDGHVRAFDWKAGTKVTCQFKRGENWYTGTVASVKGDRVSVNYDDGDKEDTTLRYCRQPSQ